jgi:hypothetical protein
MVYTLILYSCGSILGDSVEFLHSFNFQLLDAIF